MTGPWLFAQNCWGSIWYANGFTMPPSGPATFADVPMQQMKPWGHSTSLSLTFWHRLIFAIDPVFPPGSQEIWAGMWVKIYDDGGRIFRWLIVNDVSPFPYVDDFGVYHIDHCMILCRPFIGEDVPP